VKKRFLLLGFTLLILFLLWWRTGWVELWSVCRQLDFTWFVAALAMFVPQTLLSGARWSWIVRTYQPLGFWQATEFVLAGNALNIVLPSKLGDVAKGAFLRADLPGGDAATGLTLGLIEKGLDTAGLVTFMLAAAALAPPVEPLGWLLAVCGAGGILLFVALLSRPVAGRLASATHASHTISLRRSISIVGRAAAVVLHLRDRPRVLAAIVATTLFLWLLHLVQFSLVLRATGGTADTALLWSRVPMAILIGLLPVTFAGIGTRDAAMLYFLAPITGNGVALALGIFATLRYIVVATAGLPLIVRLPVDVSSLQSKQDQDKAKVMSRSAMS
jgi:glycosyltransferase 2 family protein